MTPDERALLVAVARYATDINSVDPDEIRRLIAKVEEPRPAYVGLSLLDVCSGTTAATFAPDDPDDLDFLGKPFDPANNHAPPIKQQPAELKSCADCRFLERDADPELADRTIYWKCLHTSSAFSDSIERALTGQYVTKQMYCATARTRGSFGGIDNCGEEGKHWEANT